MEMCLFSYNITLGPYMGKMCCQKIISNMKQQKVNAWNILATEGNELWRK